MVEIVEKINGIIELERNIRNSTRIREASPKVKNKGQGRLSPTTRTFSYHVWPMRARSCQRSTL
ncbi:hypothetical protein Geu3261_0093_018 [Komagataeibacter europaeus NBRC 3261]|uniref:Uncharacterized protein n=1 Tax=Komagataeibacter europaeus NBRC 3261 TaxID=1234669 RepID=A0A0D6Q194_KOMEU|nr:hypothetical protein Geu3261_0093_018 [Komagataeibacter europaeus NBRC 3261]